MLTTLSGISQNALFAGELGGAGLALAIAFILLSVLLIVFVLFRQTDSSGLGGAFGAASLSGEGAFGAKSGKVADSVISWMCLLFVVLSLLLARIVVSPSLENSAPTTGTESTNTTPAE